VDRALESICLKAMARAVPDRYATMAAFASALEGYLDRNKTLPATTLRAPEAQPGEVRLDCPRCARKFLAPTTYKKKSVLCPRCRVPLRDPLEHSTHTHIPQDDSDVATRAASTLEPVLINSVGMQLVLIPPGSFLMGSPPDEVDRDSDEGPRHEVVISQPFYLAVFPVTQEEYERVMGTNPSYFTLAGSAAEKLRNESITDTTRFPVEQVSWEDARTFCRTLAALPAERQAGRVYSLPTEAEWEYACRAGAIEPFPFHFGAALSSRQANFDGNHPYGDAETGPYLLRTCPVGSYPPNDFGLYDMHGNVWEWCRDGKRPYDEDIATDPVGPKDRTRMVRGGSWQYGAWYCRSAMRYRLARDARQYIVGFRICLHCS
jgi:formylglycine-generating enzyme required for sulfatase activity